MDERQLRDLIQRIIDALNEFDSTKPITPALLDRHCCDWWGRPFAKLDRLQLAMLAKQAGKPGFRREFLA